MCSDVTVYLSCVHDLYLVIILYVYKWGNSCDIFIMSLCYPLCIRTIVVYSSHHCAVYLGGGGGGAGSGKVCCFHCIIVLFFVYWKWNSRDPFIVPVWYSLYTGSGAVLVYSNHCAVIVCVLEQSNKWPGCAELSPCHCVSVHLCLNSLNSSGVHRIHLFILSLYSIVCVQTA